MLKSNQLGLNQTVNTANDASMTKVGNVFPRDENVLGNSSWPIMVDGAPKVLQYFDHSDTSVPFTVYMINPRSEAMQRYTDSAGHNVVLDSTHSCYVLDVPGMYMLLSESGATDSVSIIAFDSKLPVIPRSAYPADNIGDLTPGIFTPQYIHAYLDDTQLPWVQSNQMFAKWSLITSDNTDDTFYYDDTTGRVMYHQASNLARVYMVHLRCSIGVPSGYPTTTFSMCLGRSPSTAVVPTDQMVAMHIEGIGNNSVTRTLETTTIIKANDPAMFARLNIQVAGDPTGIYVDPYDTYLTMWRIA